MKTGAEINSGWKSSLNRAGLGHFNFNPSKSSAFEERSQVSSLSPNPALEWTSASWPRYAACVFSAPRGQLAAAPQLQRYAAG